MSCLPFGGLQGNSTRISVPPHYNPEVLYEVGNAVLPTANLFVTRLMARASNLPGVANGSIEEPAVSFAMHKLSVGNDQVVHRAGFSSDITDHAHLNQVYVGGGMSSTSSNLKCCIDYTERHSILECSLECGHEGRYGRCIRFLLRQAK